MATRLYCQLCNGCITGSIRVPSRIVSHTLSQSLCWLAGPSIDAGCPQACQCPQGLKQRWLSHESDTAADELKAFMIMMNSRPSVRQCEPQAHWVPLRALLAAAHGHAVCSVDCHTPSCAFSRTHMRLYARVPLLSLCSSSCNQQHQHNVHEQPAEM